MMQGLLQVYFLGPVHHRQMNLKGPHHFFSLFIWNCSKSICHYDYIFVTYFVVRTGPRFYSMSVIDGIVPVSHDYIYPFFYVWTTIKINILEKMTLALPLKFASFLIQIRKTDVRLMLFSFWLLLPKLTIWYPQK